MYINDQRYLEEFIRNLTMNLKYTDSSLALAGFE